MAAPVAESPKNEGSRNELIVRIRKEQKALWDLGNRMPIESWIDRHSSALTDSDDQLVLILGEVEMRRAGGEKPDLKEYQQRFPKLADLLELPFELMQDMAGGNEAPSEGARKKMVNLKEPEPYRISPISPMETAGTVIARKYKLLQQIGEGGMGTVWMADQMAPVKRRVAIKLIRSGRESSQNILSRFDAERQAIALMDHPNIAKLLDAGQWAGDSTGMVTPFFVMELVKGVPLIEFCDQHRLMIQERLQLFMQICGAVQHAHQKGIIHRDLKPSNILVEMHDEKPVPKVIDFGLAKATSGISLTEKTLFTGYGMIAGTPLYMAPEQARFNAIDIDTRADVYALGVLLYELLTGSTPLEREQFKLAALDEMLRMIRETDPPIPSKRLSSSESKPSVAANRHTEPAKLGKTLRGELDWIVMKALNKERDRRYESANSFAKDIERYLNHEPVNAGPPSVTYRFRKFARRYRPQVIAATLVLAALIAGFIGTTYGLFEAQKQAVIAREEKNKAVESAEQERQAKVREAERAQGERQAKEQVAAQLSQIELINNTIFGIFSELNVRKIKANNEPIEAALSKKIADAGNKLDSKAIADTLILAKLQNQLGLTLLSLGDAASASRFFTSAHKLWADKLGSNSDEALSASGNLAIAYQVQGKFEQAVQLHQEILKLLKAKPGQQADGIIICMNNLAECYRAMGKLDLAIPLMEETLKLMKATYGTDAPEIIIFMNNQAVAYRDAGKLDLAIPLYEEAIKLSIVRFGGDHPNTLLATNNLAVAYKSSGKLDQAVRLYREVLNQQLSKLSKTHPDTLVTMSNLAMAYREAGQLEDAIPLMEETLKLKTSTYGKSNPSTLMSMSNLALCYKSAGKTTQATLLNEETLKQRKEVLGADHPETLLSMLNLAQCYEDTNRLPEATSLFEMAATGMERRRYQSQNAAAIVLGAINAYEKNGQFEKAEAWRRKWLVVLRDKGASSSSDYGESLSGLGANLIHQHHWFEAEKTLRESLLIREKEGSDKWSTSNTRGLLGQALLGQKKYAEAEPFLLKAYESLKAQESSMPTASKVIIPQTLDRLVELYTAWDKKDQAEKYRQERGKYPEKKQ
ncbi:MAG TPA: serine/threonine-protein kinase [Gemmatales bacterium]|nr:serine/threonine-protein kinase [Gemmatales bacterium]